MPVGIDLEQIPGRRHVGHRACAEHFRTDRSAAHQLLHGPGGCAAESASKLRMEDLLTRIIHQPSTADGEALHSAVFSRLGVLDVP